MDKTQQKDTYKYVTIVHSKSLVNWSVSFALGNALEYKDTFKIVKIGQLIERNKTRVEILDNISYKRVTIRLYGKGVLQRDEVLGNVIGTKSQYVISSGQFIMSKIDARNGAFGIVPPELEGAVVTQDFLSYNINNEQVLPDFFLLLTSTQKFLDLCQRASSGTTGRQRVDEHAFLNFQIPLPSRDEQELLAKRYKRKIDKAKEQIETANKAGSEIESYMIEELGLKIHSKSHSKSEIHLIQFKDLDSWGFDRVLSSESYHSEKYPTITFERFPAYILNVIRGKSPKYDEKGNHLILNQKCNRWNKIELEYAKKVSDKWYDSLNKETLTKVGDILVNSTGEGTIGRASLVTKEFEGLLFDSHMLLLRVDSRIINPGYLVLLINHHYGQAQINNLKSAKSTNQTELGVQNLLKIYFPLPDISIQTKVVKTTVRLQNEINGLIKESELNKEVALKEFEKSMFK